MYLDVCVIMHTEKMVNNWTEKQRGKVMFMLELDYVRMMWASNSCVNLRLSEQNCFLKKTIE